MALVLTSWRDGYGGALRMGIEHGLYCLGSCWLFIVIVFPLGMNVAVLAIIVLLIFAEKSLPIGHQATQLAAGALWATARSSSSYRSPRRLPCSGHHEVLRADPCVAERRASPFGCRRGRPSDDGQECGSTVLVLDESGCASDNGKNVTGTMQPLSRYMGVVSMREWARGTLAPDPRWAYEACAHR
jgi:predicted metal-binding integral membrane protein DUF2182